MAVNDIVMSAAGASGPATFVEDVFSNFLYTGNNSTNTITNGIDLSTKGGMVWLKDRSTSADHNIYDTARGVQKYINSNNTSSQTTAGAGAGLTAFNSTGFTLGTNWNTENWTNDLYASWTFRKQPKFFDVVTYTGNGIAGRTVAHNLGSNPGCIFIKAYSVDTGDWWAVYHRSLGNTQAIFLTSTNVAATSSIYWNNTSPTSTNFTLGNWSGVNKNGVQYVAYLFAHDAGGFGASGTDNVISCGSFTTAGSGEATVTLGYEPQWVLFKRSNAVEPWIILDNMRGWSVGTADDKYLVPNTSGTEATGTMGYPTATGFYVAGADITAGEHIYIAIRRGPMKTPTTGTSVYNAIARTGTSASATVTGVGFSPDLVITKARTLSVLKSAGFVDRIRGNKGLYSALTQSEDTPGFLLNIQNGFNTGTNSEFNDSSGTYIHECLRRATGFFDVVCYTGNGLTSLTINHNLGVTPELIIIKSRSGAYNWQVGSNFTASNFTAGMYLNSTGAGTTVSYPHVTFYSQPTSTTFSVGASSTVNNSASTTYVAYLFASCPNVSKVGSYTGNGSSQTINCGFTAGSRFVMIKRTDSTGDWLVWDSARGIVSGNDPHLSLNSTAAEVTTDDSVDTDNTGFIVNQDTATNVNVNGATYIYLAIA